MSNDNKSEEVRIPEWMKEKILSESNKRFPIDPDEKQKFWDAVLWAVQELPKPKKTFADIKFEIAKIQSNYLGMSSDGKYIESNPSTHRIALMVQEWLDECRSFSLTEGKGISNQEAIKNACLRFYFWWHNQPGTNTYQGLDEWVKQGGLKEAIAECTDPVSGDVTKDEVKVYSVDEVFEWFERENKKGVRLWSFLKFLDKNGLKIIKQ